LLKKQSLTIPQSNPKKEEAKRLTREKEETSRKEVDDGRKSPRYREGREIWISGLCWGDEKQQQEGEWSGELTLGKRGNT